MKVLALTLSGFLLVTSLTGCARTAEVRNINNALLAPPDVKLTMQDVSKAIYTAGQRLGWRIEESRPGQMTGTLALRKHVAVVSITHDTSKISVTYKESTNLMAEGNRIHRKYNDWVENLRAGIQAEIARLATSR